MFGSEGVLETEYGGQVLIRGKQFYSGGKTEDHLRAGRGQQHRGVPRRDPAGATTRNPTVAESVRSNLVTILGRTAAYEGRVVTWDELLRRNERLVPDLNGLKT